MKFNLLLIMIMLLTGCRLLNKRSERRQEKSSLKENTMTISSLLLKDSTTLRRTVTDTSKIRWQVEIRPKGSFYFSPGQGFIGSADALKINLETRSGISESVIAEQLGFSNSTAAVTSSREASNTKDESLKDKDVKRLGLSAMVISLAGMMLLGWLWFRRRTNRVGERSL